MGLLKIIREALASESGELKKIRMQAQSRRSGKPAASASSGTHPKVEDVIEQTAAVLAKRVNGEQKVTDAGARR